jgi:uncharacterized membrane protein YjdF
MTQDQDISIYSWKKPFFTATCCLLIILLVNDAATRLYLYSGYSWIDIPMHFFGGFSVGLAVVGLLRIVYPGKKYLTISHVAYITIATLCVGIAWEIVEWYYNVSVAFGGNFWFDTSKDLLMDTLGGILSYICFRPQKKDLLIQ